MADGFPGIPGWKTIGKPWENHGKLVVLWDLMGKTIGKHGKMVVYYGLLQFDEIDPPVKVDIAMENHHFRWKNPLSIGHVQELCWFTRG